MDSELKSEINAERLTKIGAKAFSLYDSSSSDNIIGVAVVGSTLTDEFAPFESDLDVFFITDNQYGRDDGFWQLINDEENIWRERLDELVPKRYSYVDCNGLVSKNNIDEQLHPPKEVFKFREETHLNSSESD